MLRPAQIKGYLLAALSAAFYGTNPALAVPLYHAGMPAISVLLFRYLLGLPLLAVCIYWEAEGFGIRRRELVPVCALGVVMAISSLCLYEAYNYMNPGVASTLLFMYPILTALIMAVFFHEKFRIITAMCLGIMLVGIYLLMITSRGVSLNIKGIVLITISSLTYAIYLVMMKVSRTIKLVPTLKSLFYQLLAGGAVFVAAELATGGPVTPPNMMAWLLLFALALLPTVLSLLATMQAIKYIGPTPTAIFGALDPVTAVVLSVVILGETLTTREVIGGLMIIVATVLEVASVRRTD